MERKSKGENVMSKEKPETKICKHCQSEIPYKAKICPNCRKKQKSKKWIPIVIVVLIILIGLFACSDSNPSTSLSDDAKNMSESEFKSACSDGIEYKDLAKNPDSYVGTKVHLKGEIVQVCTENDSYSTYRVNITENDGWYSDTIYVVFKGSSSTRFVEDDIVEFYGESAGLYSYETVLGANQTIPQVNVVYMEDASTEE